VKPWKQRPVEIRNLFNPAFCGVVIHRALAGFFEESGEGMPFSLSLLILPLSLHKDSREAIAAASRSYLLRTLEKNPQMLVGFGRRTNAMLPFSFEAMGLLLHTNCIIVSGDGRLTTVDKTVRKTVSGTEESISAQRVARYLGREFAKIGDRVTIYTSLGVRP
jgi:hypothetical protein